MKARRKRACASMDPLVSHKDDEPRLLHCPLPPRERERLASGGHRARRLRRRSARPRPARGHEPAAPAGREPKREPGEEPLHLRDLLLGHRLERLPPEHLVGAVPGLAGARLSPGAVEAEAGVRASHRLPRARHRAIGARSTVALRVGQGTSLPPPPAEQLVEHRPVLPPELERALERGGHFVAVEQVHQRERGGRVHLLAQAHRHAPLAQRARERRQMSHEPALGSAAPGQPSRAMPSRATPSRVTRSPPAARRGPLRRASAGRRDPSGCSRA